MVAAATVAAFGWAAYWQGLLLAPGLIWVTLDQVHIKVISKFSTKYQVYTFGWPAYWLANSFGFTMVLSTIC